MFFCDTSELYQDQKSQPGLLFAQFLMGWRPKPVTSAKIMARFSLSLFGVAHSAAAASESLNLIDGKQLSQCGFSE